MLFDLTSPSQRAYITIVLFALMVSAYWLYAAKTRRRYYRDPMTNAQLTEALSKVRDTELRDQLSAALADYTAGGNAITRDRFDATKTRLDHGLKTTRAAQEQAKAFR